MTSSHRILLFLVVAFVPLFLSAQAVAQPECSGAPLVLTEFDLGLTDAIEIQNVSGAVLNTAGWTVAISESPYSDLNTVNPIIQPLPPTMAAGEIMYWTDSTSDNFWGNNIFWNPGEFPSFSGWAIILDDTGAIVDFAVWNGIPELEIAGINLIIDGFLVSIGDEWLFDGIITGDECGSGFSVQRQGSADHDDALDWMCLPTNLGEQNPGLFVPFDDCVVEIAVDMDIKFCSDPNAFNCKKKGVLPVTIFGTEDFLVEDVDPSTLQLCTADLSACTGAPRDYSYADRGDPLLDLGVAECAIDPDTGMELDWTDNYDGYLDMDVAFEASEVKTILGDFCAEAAKGEVSEALVIVGETYDGVPIYSVPADDNTGIDRLVKKN